MFLELFLSFLQVGAFSLGGGYAALPLIQEQIVTQRGWMTMADFGDILAISQMTPGPIAINASTFVGTRMGGIPGSIVATLGCVTAPFIISIIMAKLYYKYRNLSLMQGVLGGLRPAVVALIASAGISIFITAIWGEGAIGIATIDWVAMALFVIAFAVLRKFKLNQVYVMLGSGILGMIVYLILGA